MKYVTNIICCLAFAIAGISLAIQDNPQWSGITKHQTLSAATLPTVQATSLPLDVQLDLGKRVQTEPTVILDTIVRHDTVYVDRPQLLVVNPKSPKVRKPKGVTDYSWMMLTPKPTFGDAVNNKGAPVREEKAGENVDSTKEASIQLTVDGKVVYSKNVNHSTGESQ